MYGDTFVVVDAVKGMYLGYVIPTVGGSESTKLYSAPT